MIRDLSRNALIRVAIICGAGLGALEAPSTSAAALAQDAANAAMSDVPFALDKVIKIPDVPLWPYSDSMTLDVAGERLFATPQGAKSVAVLDLKSGRVLKMIAGIGNPHGIVFLPQLKRLFVVDGATGSVKVYDSDDYGLIKTIPLALGADMAAYDPRSRIFYVNNGGAKAEINHSMVSAIDTGKMEKLFDVPLNALDVEGSTVDPEGQYLYAALPEEFAIAVVDLKKKQVVDTWKMPGSERSPWFSAVDSARGRLYVACRDSIDNAALHGSLVVLDIKTGRPIATLPIGGWADSLHIDKKRNRIYISTGVGRIETFDIGPNDTFHRRASVETALLAKTSLYSSELDRMFVTAPNLGLSDAKVMVFKPFP